MARAHRPSLRAPILVHGATGFTGRLVCEALLRRGLDFSVSGRSEERLTALVEALGGGIEAEVVDVDVAASVDAAIRGRRLVCACAGPFVDFGKPIIDACVRAGVDYLDTTGEQDFVAWAIATHHRAARDARIRIAPATGYEIAPASWAADLAVENLGVTPEELTILYAISRPDGSLFETSRGTKRSALAIVASGAGQQFVDGALVNELPGTTMRDLPWGEGEWVAAVSFPSIEANLLPARTGARTVRTFVAPTRSLARALHFTRSALPSLARLVRPWLDGVIARSKEVPDPVARRSTPFRIRVDARASGRTASVTVHGHDPYGITAVFVAHAAEQAMAPEFEPRVLETCGVVAPSVAFPARRAFQELSAHGVTIVESGRPSTGDVRRPEIAVGA